jgi:hypothetical protein
MRIPRSLKGGWRGRGNQLWRSEFKSIQTGHHLLERLEDLFRVISLVQTLNGRQRLSSITLLNTCRAITIDITPSNHPISPRCCSPRYRPPPRPNTDGYESSHPQPHRDHHRSWESPSYSHSPWLPPEPTRGTNPTRNPHPQTDLPRSHTRQNRHDNQHRSRSRDLWGSYGDAAAHLGFEG